MYQNLRARTLHSQSCPAGMRRNSFITQAVSYHLVGKYRRQARLMTMHKTFISKTCLASDIVSMTFTYFLNSAHPSLKYDI
jgi:hypothetical protein